jgi:hypothetical protein
MPFKFTVPQKRTINMPTDVEVTEAHLLEAYIRFGKNLIGQSVRVTWTVGYRDANGDYVPVASDSLDLPRSSGESLRDAIEQKIEAAVFEQIVRNNKIEEGASDYAAIEKVKP